MTDDDKIHILSSALREIVAKAEKAWMPVRCFRSEEQAAMDDARHEAWEAAADIAKSALEEIEPRCSHWPGQQRCSVCGMDEAV